MKKTDVIIVGAGPTGLALACKLIRYGIDFVIFDKKETTTTFSKAIGVQARSFAGVLLLGRFGKLALFSKLGRHPPFARGKPNEERRQDQADREQERLFRATCSLQASTHRLHELKLELGEALVDVLEPSHDFPGLVSVPQQPLRPALRVPFLCSQGDVATSCVAKPTNEITSEVTEVGTAKVNLPSLPVAVPVPVFFATTFTPARGEPFSLSVTTPETSRVCAIACTPTNNSKIRFSKTFFIKRFS